MASNVALLKLTNGDEVIGEIISTSIAQTTIKNPVRVVVVPSKTDARTPTVGFAPWAEFSEEKEFAIDKSHIIVIMKPIQEFINQYNSMFGGIVAPSSKLIIP
jgi:beta-lactam-binding protein with PASTA domain